MTALHTDTSTFLLTSSLFCAIMKRRMKISELRKIIGCLGWRKRKNVYLCTMFVRKKNNRSGTISVVVVSKAHGKFTEVKKFGVAKSEEEADELFQKAQVWLRTHGGQQELDFDDR